MMLFHMKSFLSRMALAFLVVLPPACGPRSQPNENSGAIVLEEFVFMNSPHFRSCHSASILELPDGELLCTFFAGTRESHPDVEIWLCRKPKGGTWSPPVSVADGKESGMERMSTGNPVLFRERGGKIFLFYKVIDPDIGFIGRLKTSTDGGHTWSDAQPVGDGLMGAVKNKPIQLANGTILSPSSTEDEYGWRVHIERSTDGGVSWELIGPINPETAIGAIQPTLMTYPDGRIQMYCRTRSEHGFIARSWSEDSGESWTPLEPAVLPNNNSGIDAATLADGRQLLVYNHSTRNQEGMGHKGRGILNVAVSDNGIDWEAALILDYLDQAGKQFSYPSVIQTRDGLVHIVYTWHRERIKHVVLDPENLETTPMPAGIWPETGSCSLENFKLTTTQMR
jgi:predicted neuraminidase